MFTCCESKQCYSNNTYRNLCAGLWLSVLCSYIIKRKRLDVFILRHKTLSSITTIYMLARIKDQKSKVYAASIFTNTEGRRGMLPRNVVASFCRAIASAASWAGYVGHGLVTDMITDHSHNGIWCRRVLMCVV